MCILFLLSDTTEFVVTNYFLHVGLSLAYEGSNMERSTVLQKKALYIGVKNGHVSVFCYF